MARAVAPSPLPFKVYSPIPSHPIPSLLLGSGRSALTAAVFPIPGSQFWPGSGGRAALFGFTAAGWAEPRSGWLRIRIVGGGVWNARLSQLRRGRVFSCVLRVPEAVGLMIPEVLRVRGGRGRQRQFIVS